jgi:RNase P subunit RPR2
MKLNRTELLIILDEKDETKLERTNKLMREMKKQYYTRIEYLIMTESELINSLKSPERNAIKEMLSNKIALHLPQNFWMLIRNACAHGMHIKFEIRETNPANIGETDLLYNLARFGYKELGPEIQQGQDFSIEYITASILLNDNRRRISAIPLILAKNKANYNLLTFLSQRYGFAERLLGLLITLGKIAPAKGLENAIMLLKGTGIHPIKPDEAHIRNTLLLYGVNSK